MKDIIRQELTTAKDTLETFLNDDKNLELIEQAAKALVKSFKNGGKVISCGNGGSSCDAAHFAEELTGRYRENRPALPAITVNDHGHLTCVGNDYGYDEVFARFVEGVGFKGDVLLGISTSGNSKNIIRACEVAKSQGMFTIALTGKDGGALIDQVDLEIRVPYFGFADRIQEVHIKIIHILILLIEKEMFE